MNTSNSFSALPCKAVRLGNYEVQPRGRVLTTQQHIQMRVPRIPILSSSISSKEEYILLEIPLEEVLNVLVHFGPRLPVLFIFLSPWACRNVRDQLNMTTRHGFFLDNCAALPHLQLLTILVRVL